MLHMSLQVTIVLMTLPTLRVNSSVQASSAGKCWHLNRACRGKLEQGCARPQYSHCAVLWNNAACYSLVHRPALLLVSVTCCTWSALMQAFASDSCAMNADTRVSISMDCEAANVHE